jgi:membrane-bound lytic murein transglycosylase B
MPCNRLTTRTPFRRWRSSLAALLLLVAPVTAVCGADETRSGDFDRVVERLVADGFDSQVLADIFSRPEVVFEARGVALFFVHSEARLNYGQFLAPDRIAKACTYMGHHAEALARSEALFGVEQEIVTAILLVETQLGTITGSRGVLNTLATMAALAEPRMRERLWVDMPAERRPSRPDFDAKADGKSRWAYGELKALLTYAGRENLDPAAVLGSYAGALGICQFMPSNALRLGIDGGGDGRIDLFDHADAIASVGNYLQHHGWRRDLSPQRKYEVLLRYNYSKPYAETILEVARQLKG